MSVKINYLIAKLKFNALKLRGSYQLPSYLCYLINQLDKDSSKSYVMYLMYQADNMMRVKGYYKRYPKDEENYNSYLKKQVSKKFLDKKVD